MYKQTFFEQLTLKYGLEGKYFEEAEKVISAWKKDLGRDLNLDEAAMVLAQKGIGDMKDSILRVAAEGARTSRVVAFHKGDSKEIETLDLFRRTVLFGVKKEKEGD